MGSVKFDGPRRGALVCLVAVALLARLTVAAVLGLNSAPRPGSDQQEFDTYAWNVAQGRGYRGLSPDVTDQDHLTAYRPPLPSLVWAVLYRVFGHRYDVVRVCHCILGALTVVLIYGIGRQSFGESVGLMAAGVYAVYPTALLYSSELLAESLATFLFCAYLLLSLQFAQRPGVGRRQSQRRPAGG